MSDLHFETALRFEDSSLKGLISQFNEHVPPRPLWWPRTPVQKVSVVKIWVPSASRDDALNAIAGLEARLLKSDWIFALAANSKTTGFFALTITEQDRPQAACATPRKGSLAGWLSHISMAWRDEAQPRPGPTSTEVTKQLKTAYEAARAAAPALPGQTVRKFLISYLYADWEPELRKFADAQRGGKGAVVELVYVEESLAPELRKELHQSKVAITLVYNLAGDAPMGAMAEVGTLPPDFRTDPPPALNLIRLHAVLGQTSAQAVLMVATGDDIVLGRCGAHAAALNELLTELDAIGRLSRKVEAALCLRIEDACAVVSRSGDTRYFQDVNRQPLAVGRRLPYPVHICANGIAMTLAPTTHAATSAPV